MKKCWFDYKTIIVTGASSGIGRGLVKKLIKDHRCEVIGIARDEDKIKSLINELGDDAHLFSYRLFDVSVRENWENFAAELQREYIYPDVLINNAGVLPTFNKFANYSMKDIENAMQVNFYSCVYSMRCMLPLILKSPTAGIINVASAAALCSVAGTSIYSASKSALKSLTDAIREEYRGKCYVGLVCPGFTKTDIFRHQKDEENERKEKLISLAITACDRMVYDVINGMWKKKSNMVFGIDAHLMSIGNRAFGTGTSLVSSKVLAKANLEMFADVFTETNEKRKRRNKKEQ